MYSYLLADIFSFGNRFVLPALPGVAAALVSGYFAYILFKKKSKEEFKQLVWTKRNTEVGQLASLRQRYITPLRYWALLLDVRMKELEEKHLNNYQETRKWFQEVKDHATGDGRIANFPFWSCYEGIFSITTVYWTAQFLQASREIRYLSPFNELDSKYDNILQGHLGAIRKAFMGEWGLWDSSQEIVAELVSNGTERTWNYQDFCKALDSRDNFIIGPLLRPLDYYIQYFSLDDSRRIQASLQAFIQFIDSKTTPERSM